MRELSRADRLRAVKRRMAREKAHLQNANVFCPCGVRLVQVQGQPYPFCGTCETWLCSAKCTAEHARPHRAMEAV